MDDTDQVLRVTTPFIRPTPESLREPFEDPTPTTGPRRRFARGTMTPPAGAVVPVPSSTRRSRVVARPALDAEPALAIKLIDSPRDWGFIVRIDLGPRLAPVAGEITAPVPRIGAFNWRPLAAGGLAATMLLAAVLALTVGRSSSAASSAPAAVAAAAPALVAAPVQPVQPPAIVVTPIVIQLPDEPEAPAAAAPAEIEMPEDTVADPGAAAPVAPAATHGVLMIGSKPPCRIFIDGKDTGLTTPQRAVRVPAGRRTITLRNDEFGIVNASTVVVTGGRKAKLIRDLSAQIDG